MRNTQKEMLFSTIQDRVVNATCLAEVITQAAYSHKADVSDVAASCEILREYLNNTWELTNDFHVN